MFDGYIHYGTKKFKQKKFVPMYGSNPAWGKPSGGLWASPINSPYQSWKEWCECNDFDVEKLKNHFTFNLSNEANILKIHSDDDLNHIKQIDYYWNASSYKNLFFKTLNFEALQELGYDGIEIYMASSDIYYAFYGWDVDSLLLWNPDVMIF